MSENYLRIIPADPNLVPTRAVANQIVDLVRRAFPAADEVVAERHRRPTFIDQGENLEAILCPACGKRLALQAADEVGGWWHDLADSLHNKNLTSVEATMPCCRRVVPFTTLEFDWPAGVASFEISIRSPGTTDPLSARLQRKVEALLGTPVKYVRAHY